MAANAPLKSFFHVHQSMYNKSHHNSYCVGCVSHYEELARTGPESWGIDVEAMDAAAKLRHKDKSFSDACTRAKAIRGEKSPWTTHILGGGAGNIYPACKYASSKAIAAATEERAKSIARSKNATKRDRSDTSVLAADLSITAKKLKQASILPHVFKGNTIPFSPDEAKAIRAQCCKAMISANLPARAFEDPEMQIVFGMMRTAAPVILPTGKVLLGSLLNDAGKKIDGDLAKALHKKQIGLSTDGWKSNKDAVNAVCANVEFKSYTLKLVEVTAQNKDGRSHCKSFGEIIDKAEEEYECTVIYFCTDADGGSCKGRKLLGIERPWLLVPSCWAHQFQLILGDYFKVYAYGAQIAGEATELIGWLNNHGKVRKLFDAIQAQISAERTGTSLILAYLVANLTRWTTHYISFARLLRIGAATSTEGQRLREDAEKMCDLISDGGFWNGVETVVGDMEPICYGTNINQCDSTRADQVLKTLAGLFLHFKDHPEPEVATGMLSRLEKRWKDCDQLLFLLTLILNPFEGFSCFGPNANLSHLKCHLMLVSLYRRMSSRPDNPDTEAQKAEKEKELSSAFMHYLAGTGPFEEWRMMREDWIKTNGTSDPIRVWEAIRGDSKVKELVNFAIILLLVVVNQGGCERVFSDLKIKQTDRRNRLGLPKLEKMTKIGASIRLEHQKLGIIRNRQKRKNHQSTEKLLAVPRYADLLEDMDAEDEEERGRLLVSSEANWRTEMAKWIGAARDEERAERRSEWDSDSNSDDEGAARSTVSWKPLTLTTLFSGIQKPARVAPSVYDEEAQLMEALAEQEADEQEDNRLDDGAIDFSDDDYVE